MSDADWSEAENVLAVRLDALGDVLMTTPAVRALKESKPGRRVTLFTSPAGAGIAPLLPDIDGTLVYDAPWMKATAPRADSRPEFAMVERLRAGCFDAAVIFTVYSQNPLPAAFLCQLADVPLRLAHCRENPYQLLTDWVPEPEPQQFTRHEARRQLDLVASVGCRAVDERMRVRVPDEAAAHADQALRWFGLDDTDRWVVIHPGASAPSRRYPPEKFAHAARLLVAEHDVQVVFTGSESERELVEEIRAGMGAYSFSLAGELNLAEMAALLARAPLLISNNTGPVHLACAVGTPVVDLYALTNPQHTPWGVPNRVLNRDVPCRNCYKSVCPEGHHNCLRLVPAEDVARAACELMGDSGAPPSPPAAAGGLSRSLSLSPVRS